MKVRLRLSATIDVDVLHPTFIAMLDPRNVEKGAEWLDEDDPEDVRSLMALDGYLGMAIAKAQRDGRTIAWEVEAAETICRVCGCTDEAACEGGCSWVDVDLCSACEPERTAIG